MEFGTSNAVALRAVAEVTFGTTPASPALDAIRFTSESLNFSSNFTTSQEIRSDRMTPDTIQTEASAAGDINGELSYGTYDSLMEAGLFSTWATTGTTVAAATDIAIVKTAGPPNTYKLTASVTDFTAQAWVVGQMVKVTGFTTAGTFWAQIVEITDASNLVIYPLTDVASEVAGDSVTITPLNYLRNGTTKKSFTIQKAFTDLTTPEFWNFTGCRIGGIEFDLATNAILNTKFSVMALSAAMTTAQFGSATINAANTNDVMNAVDNVAAIAFDGDPGATAYYFSKLTIKLDNKLRGQSAIGTLGYVGVEPGRLSSTGSIELYFQDSTHYDKFKAATAFALSFMVEDAAGNSYIFTLPRCKFTKMEIVAGGLDQDIMAKADFEALVNSAGTYQVQISRS